jgi:hypothetical protein
MSSVMRLCVLALLAPAMASAAAPPAASGERPEAGEGGFIKLVVLTEDAGELLDELKEINGRLGAMIRRYEVAKEFAQALREAAEKREQEEKPSHALPSIPSVPPPEVVYIDRQRFTIPIRVLPERQREVRELLLYLSRDRGKTWEVYARATPDKRGFDFSSDSDGLFYFSIMVIDRNGRQNPPDVSAAPVGQAICIDTKKPQLELTAERSGDEIQVAYTIEEDHPERESVKLEYKAGEQWTPLPIEFAPRGKMRFKPGARGTVVVRLSMRDLALNETIVERTVAATDGESASEGEFASERCDEPVEEATTPPPARAPLPPLQIVNRKQATLDFDVTRVGPSGVGGVDLYVTTDEGETWEKSQADHKLELPLPAPAGKPGSVTVTLPKDGVIYGFSLVVKSRAGLGKSPPRPGDVPQVRLELDTTQPEAELYAPQADSKRPDCLVLTWKASDRNLAAKPISIEWAERPDGPWSFIGDLDRPPTGSPDLDRVELTNSGRFVWQIAEKTPPKVYLRLSVRDTAGNVAVAVTPQPVLIDLMTPEVGSVRVRTRAKADNEENGPKAELYSPQADSVRPDCLLLTWKASGDNLAAKPITLEWACREDGPWTFIGEEQMPNTGRYLWQIEENTPAKVYLRLTVRDRAGKATVVQTPCLLVIGRTEVKGFRIER